MNSKPSFFSNILNSKWWLFIKICFSLILVLFFLNIVDWQKMRTIIQNVNSMVLLFIVFLVFVRNFISSFRFKVLCDHHKKVSLLELNKHYFIASTFNLFMPTSIGGDALRIGLLEKENVKKETGFLFVVTERFLGLFSFVLLALIGLFFIPTNAYLIYMVAGVNLLFFISCIILFYVKIPSITKIPIFQKLINSFNLLRNEKLTLIRVILISIVFQILSIYMRYLLAVAFGLDIGLGYFLVFIPLINLVTLLPISLGGIGLRESAFVYFFSNVGGIADNETSLILSLSTYFILLTTGIIGLFVYFYESFINKSN